MKAFTVSQLAKVHAYTAPVSMIYSFPMLTQLVSAKLKRKPESGDLFLFHNKARDYVKVLYFDHNGFCIWSKKLPRGNFDTAGIGKHMTISELEAMVNQVVIMGGKRLPHLKLAKAA